MELYSENTRKGKDYNTNLVFIQINLNAFNTNGKILTEYYISDPKTGEIYLENFIFYALDIVKCYKLFYNLDEEKITDNIRWGAFLYCDNLNELNNIIGNMLNNEDISDITNKTIEEIKEIENSMKE